jgi:hypothetical protein
MMMDIILVLVGTLIGYSACSLFAGYDDSADMKMANKVITELLQDMDKLFEEIEQHGLEWYRRKGELELRKPKAKRKTPKKITKKNG